MNVRAKFRCNLVQDNPEYENKTVEFSAVTNGSEENKSFSKYTPSGNMSITISYDTEAVDAFERGKDYYIDFSPAE